MLIAIPTGVKIFNWISTMWGGAIRFTTAMKFATALVGMFTIGGLSGVMHSSPPADLQQTDTYFIVAHFHYVLFGGSMMGLFAGTYFYYPKFSGRLMSERLGSWNFWVMFVGMNLTFFPMHFSGLAGMPRRIYTYDANQGYTSYNLMSSIGTAILVVGVAIGLYNMWRSWTRGAVAGNDPWQGGTLEWSMPSPPPDYNFAELPYVTSRYPLWDVKHPELTREVPHSRHGDERVGVAAGTGLDGHEVAVVHTSGAGSAGRGEPGADVRVNARIPTAAELGIPMPNPSILPLVVAFFVVVMFSGLLLLDKEGAKLGITTIIVGALGWVCGLYAWLMTPLEDPH
jgi:cytochrome c oxidase subunit 1